MWTPVAMMAVIKSGAAGILLDTEQPIDRLISIVNQARPALILSSKSTTQLATKLSQNQVQHISTEFLQSIVVPPSNFSHSIEPTSPAAVVFTSGSTGTPKGALLTHENFCSAIHHHVSELQFRESTRLYQFSSYAFDLAWVEVLYTFAAGGCVCIPSSTERNQDLSGSIHRFKANYLILTPTLFRIMDPASVPTLECVTFAGEPMCNSDAARWPGIHIMNIYGPAECTVISTVSHIKHNQTAAINLGRGIGVRTWVIDDSTCEPAAIGAVGELWMEGPLVSAGYLNNPEKTTAAYIINPPWLSRGIDGIAGRSTRLYRTGDLARYNGDGSLQFMGRKDTQVKIRGQRAELGDIELHILALLRRDEARVAVEMVVDQHVSVLTAFITMTGELPDNLEEQLAQAIPSWMVPTFYVKLDKFPLTPTGKTDRKALRASGSRMNLTRPSSKMSTGQDNLPLTAAESTLRSLWASVLETDVDTINATSSFLRMGGNSVTAMHLISEARKQNLHLTVRDVISQPTLRDLARRITAQPDCEECETPPPFSLVNSSDTEATLQKAASLCGIRASDITDIYPCTPLQKGLLAMTLKTPGDYISHLDLEIRQDINLQKLKEAYQHVLDHLVPILRTRIVDLGNLGLVQVVVKEPIHWLREGESPTIGLGSPLTYAKLSSVGGKRYFTLVQHHAVYDGWSRSLVLEALTQTYYNQKCAALTAFPSFLKYLTAIQGSKEFWASELSTFNATHFPSTREGYSSRANLSFGHKIDNISWSHEVTSDSVIRSAWALLISLYSESSDVVLGVVVSGRHAAVPDLDRLPAPTIATVPVRIRINETTTVSQLFKNVQNQAIDMVQFEQYGLHNIRQINQGANHACQFQSLLVVQPPLMLGSPHKNSLFEEFDLMQSNLRQELIAENELGTDNADADAKFNTYPLTLHCQQDEASLVTKFVFDSQVASSSQVKRISQQFEHILRALTSPGQCEHLVKQLKLVTPQDMKRLIQWNKPIKHEKRSLVHETISSIADLHSNSTAVHGWDGALTYSELESLSTKLAHILLRRDIGKGSIIPICFEKSIWMPVCALAVWKSGAASVAIDPAQPRERLQDIMGCVDASITLCGHSSELLVKSLSNTEALVVGFGLIVEPTEPPRPLPNVEGNDLAYVVFTSGSTGKPKGAMISHVNIAAAIDLQRDAMSITSAARVADFCSYAFDVSWSNLFHTFANGACLCIPSDRMRQESFSQFLIDFKVTYLHLTPSVAAIMDLTEVATLEVVHLSGELVDFDKLSYLQSFPRVIISYGPAECTVTASVTEKHPLTQRATIGWPVGSNAWIVDPDQDRILPIGAVGELVLQGPLVGQGYFKNPKQTAKAFIDGDSCLFLDSGSYKSACHRLYRTGDLAHFTEDGELIFVGRKDTQIKINGQRTEIADIEHHVYCLLQSRLDISDVVVTLGKLPGGQRDRLVAFLCINKVPNDHMRLEIVTAIKNLLAGIRTILPDYMIPKYYLPLAKLPQTPSGKTDRRALSESQWRDNAHLISAFELNGPEPFQEPNNETEKTLRSLWAVVLDMSEETIGRHSNFFHLGGCSIAAMRLVAAAYKSGKRIHVPDIFKQQTLAEMAAVLTDVAEAVREDLVIPFSQLQRPMDLEHILRNAADACSTGSEKIKTSQIEDIFPCTALQAGLFALTLREPGQYVQKLTAELRPKVDLSRFQMAWERVAMAAPILRTRIVDLLDQGPVQVVLRESLHWYNTIDSTTVDIGDIGIGTPLSFFHIQTLQDKVQFVLIQHHSVYDGWCLSLIQRQVEKVYQDMTTFPVFRPLQLFTRYVQSQDTAQTELYWENQFKDLTAIPFPRLPAKTYMPRADITITRSFPLQRTIKQHGLSEILRASWSILIHWYTRSDDVVFGSVVSGRQIAMNGIENVAGPTIATVPVRIRIQGSIDKFLRQIRDQSLLMVPHEQFGLQNIRRVSRQASSACDFQTLMLIQPPKANEKSSNIFVKPPQEDSDQTIQFNTYSMMITCSIKGATIVDVQLCFDSKVVEEAVAARMLDQFQHIAEQLLSLDTETDVHNLSEVNDLHLGCISKWNRQVLQPIESCVHHLFSQRALQSPRAAAVNAWDGRFTYEELENLSTQLAIYLINEIDVRVGDIVPLYFNKSAWVPVAVIGAMKAGATSVLIDTTLPKGRISSIWSQLAPKVLLTSTVSKCSAPESVISDTQVVVVERDLFCTIQKPLQFKLPTVPSSTSLYIVFTSGSTGKPKGVIITHENFASALHYQREKLGIEPSSRVYDGVSFSFDVAWSNMLHTLTAGACLCIPSETDRTLNVNQSIQQLDANFLHITPTLSRLLDASSLSIVQKLLFIGENLQASDVDKWSVNGRKIYNTYGPAECTVTSTIHQVTKSTTEPSIGKGAGASTWIVHPGEPSKLAALGTVGELWLEGPIVGRGYLNSPSQTKECFFEDPQWYPCSIPRKSRLYRTGDLVYYNPDGSLVFVGRKDRQVKINGQRFELAEVELHAKRGISTDFGVGVAAEIIVPSSTTTPTLALFLSADGKSLDKKERFEDCISGLQSYFSCKLPTFMNPTAYIVVETLPMTSSGKIDRQALRALGKEYIPSGLAKRVPDYHTDTPFTSTETELAKIYSHILGIEFNEIRQEHTFQHLGGDSIKTVSLAVAIRKKWQITMTLATLLGPANSLAEISGSIDRLVRGYHVSVNKLDMDSELASLVCSLERIKRAPKPRSVFLTGATGFLGVEILRTLLASGKFDRIILLVRVDGKLSGTSRIIHAAERAGWWKDAYLQALEVWEGRLEEVHFGLDLKAWNSLASVAAIIHNGARVHWTSSYEELKATNVQSTLQLLQCTLQSSSEVNFVYVSGGLLTAKDEWTAEERTAATGYDQTKYISERLVQAASLQNYSAKTRFSVVKPGQIIGDVYNGIANPDDFLWRVARCAVEMGIRPAEAGDSFLIMSDARHVSDLVVSHATGTRQESFSRIMRGMPIDIFWDTVARSLDRRSLQTVTWDEWIAATRVDIEERRETHILWPVQEFLGPLGVPASYVTSSELDVGDLAAAVRQNVLYLHERGLIGVQMPPSPPLSEDSSGTWTKS